MTDKTQNTLKLTSVIVTGLAVGGSVVVSPLIPLIAMVVGAAAVGIAEVRKPRN